MPSKSLTWNGEAVSAAWKEAQIKGVNAAMGAAVNHAKRNHPWKNRTGILEGAINVTDPARPIATGVEGVWGVNDAVQARILEVGGVITAKNAAALAIPLPGGGVVLRKSVTIPAYPYLRPAADAVYPSLAMRIQKAHAKIGGGASDD
ncbi:hypothetical protein [Sphingopyxis sp. GW247-27LB]|uniref:hypothetical protein n=1 Tax=Sphingopyxis sp. GW247-27LB TaxID=2012632 RepID=UPI001C3EF59B|nr:hypothetical protein [Sphingopyxis sp. GW247-27LB]